jgi:hypothetical protein
LIPAVPVNSDGRATRAINVSALFNQGNILQDSYREEFLDYGTETQNIIATVIYRETEIDDVFPRNASVSVSVKGISEDESVRQTFDLSQFVTRRKQAILFGKLACNQRRYVRKAIEFKTIPTDSPVSPGSYIIVDIGLNTWDEMTSGVVLPGGALSIPLNDKIAAGSYSMLLYKAGSPTITLENVSIDANLVAQQAAEYAGRLFVLGKVIENRRVFRVNEVQMDEEGEVTIKATNYPCDNDGTRLLSRVANFSDDEFEVV